MWKKLVGNLAEEYNENIYEKELHPNKSLVILKIKMFKTKKFVIHL